MTILSNLIQYMLDLKKLEKELDEQLAKETPESLRQWLRSIRVKSQCIKLDDDQQANDTNKIN